MRFLTVFSLCLLLAGCSANPAKTTRKSIAGDPSLPEISTASEKDQALLRSAMQHLAELLRAQPSTNQFEFFWNQSDNQKMMYDRTARLLKVDAGDAWIEYAPVTDEAIYAVAAAQQTHMRLVDHGARQKMKITREALGLPSLTPRSPATGPRQ